MNKLMKCVFGVLGVLLIGVLTLAVVATPVEAKKKINPISDYSKDVSDTADKGEVETNLMGTIEDSEGEGCGVYTVINLIITILTYGVAIAATLGLVITGILYITSRDNAGQLAKAKTRALEIIVGLAMYAVMWGAAQWLVPGGIFNEGDICSQTGSGGTGQAQTE